MGSFILWGEVWIRIQFQATLLMIHISQDSASCIDGEHNNDSLSENVVVVFNRYYCKKWYVSISVSSRFWQRPGRRPARHWLAKCRTTLLSLYITFQAHSLRAAATFQCLADLASLPLSVRRWYNAKAQTKLWLIGWMLA